MISQQITGLRDFLVPENGPDRLVKNWLNNAEDDKGWSVSAHSELATKFCLVGDLSHLFMNFAYSPESWVDYNNTRDFLEKFRHHNYKVRFLYFFEIKRVFWICSKHSAKEVRSFLNPAIQLAKEQGL
jgi:hypothetical protein